MWLQKYEKQPCFRRTQGAASHAASWVLNKVLFKKQGLPVGEDVESILSRVETLLEEGELDAAAREMNGLEGWAKVLSKGLDHRLQKSLGGQANS